MKCKCLVAFCSSPNFIAVTKHTLRFCVAQVSCFLIPHHCLLCLTILIVSKRLLKLFLCFFLPLHITDLRISCILLCPCRRGCRDKSFYFSCFLFIKIQLPF